MLKGLWGLLFDPTDDELRPSAFPLHELNKLFKKFKTSAVARSSLLGIFKVPDGVSNSTTKKSGNCTHPKIFLHNFYIYVPCKHKRLKNIGPSVLDLMKLHLNFCL